MSEILRAYQIDGETRLLPPTEAKRFKDMKYTVKLVISPDNPVVRVIELSRGTGSGNCEFCENSPPPTGILKATRRLVLKNGDVILSCSFHNPLERVPEVYGRD